MRACLDESVMGHGGSFAPRNLCASLLLHLLVIWLSGSEQDTGSKLSVDHAGDKQIPIDILNLLFDQLVSAIDVP